MLVWNEDLLLGMRSFGGLEGVECGRIGRI